MPRPTIVIGLGGTGQWILTFLKKELLEIGGGSMPPGIKLLSFDTTSRATAKTGQGAPKEDAQAVKAGAVELVEGKEFIPIGNNVSQLASEIAQGKHSHLQWFPANSFLSKLPASSFNTKEGSGQIRHMGRISIFRDLSALQKSEILSRLRAAIQDIQGKVSRDLQLEIAIVGSLAGGTGAGMLVDMAILAREQASRLVANNYVVRGFFILPRAFSAAGVGESRDMLARSFAAWRELDRFMIVGERFGVRQINYHEINQDLRIKVNRRAFDVSYMIDPARQTVNSLDGVRAEEGLFPAVAQVLSLIMDDKAGKAYTEFVTTNLSGKLAQLPRHPYHSVIGSYTIKVPVYYAREKFSHQLALDALREFLAPEFNEKRRVIRVSEKRNQEPTAAQPGWASVRNFMGASGFNIDGADIPNTKFLPMVSECRDKQYLREGAVIQKFAQGGLTSGQSRVLISLTDIGQDEEGKLITRNIMDELQVPIWRDVPPSHQAGDTPEQAFPRIRARVADVRAERYGIDTAGGERLRGKYGKALEQAKSAQVARFKKLLHAWTKTTLNGLNSDPLLARGGKIGYVRVFYEELIQTFSYFNEFLNKVRLVRNEELRLASRSKEAAERALKTYELDRGKKCPFAFFDDFTHPDAHRAQRNYLQAVQRDIDVRKDDILLDVLAETSSAMRKIAENTLADIDAWIAHLAIGDQNLGITGLYLTAVDSLSNVNVNHEWDKRLSRVGKIIGEHEYQSDPKYVAETLGALRWEVNIGDNSLELFCGVDMPSDEQGAPSKYIHFYRAGERPEEHNLNLILQLAERPYAALHVERPLAKEISKVYPTGKKLAEDIHNLAEPLYMVSSVPQGPEVVACYVRVHSDINEETSRYFADFLQEMKDRKPDISKGASLTLVDSEDMHKLTVVRSDDLLPSTDFDMWHKCREAYIAQVTDPHRGIPAAELHIFPAEINACYYESRMPLILRQDYRILHPEVVALLEDRERFEMFFRSIALGFLKEDDSKGQPFWAFKLPDDVEPLYVTVPSGKLDGNVKEDVLNIVHNFVMEACDQRPGVGQAKTIHWDRLREAILVKQREFGKEKTIKRYQDEINNPKGLIQKMRAEVESKRRAESNESIRSSLGQEYLDLADLATLVYRDAIQALS